MFIQTWGEVFSGSLQDLWLGFMSFVPSLLGAIIIFIIGWIVGSVIGKVIKQLIGALKIEKLLQSTGTEAFFEKAGLKFNIGGFIGGLVKWFLIIVFLMASLQILGLSQVNDFLREAVLYYLPKVIIAAFVLIIATYIAGAMKKIITASAKAANASSANLLGSIASYAIWVFAFIIALSELGIAAQLMQIIFTGLIAMLAIAGGLAFGLGGKEAASRTIDKVSKDFSSKM